MKKETKNTEQKNSVSKNQNEINNNSNTVLTTNSSIKAGSHIQEPKKMTTFFIVVTALFTAMVFLFTWLINIPVKGVFGVNGNINLGDGVIYIASFVLGPIGGLIAGALGSSLADIATGYLVYAPFTLIIKGLQGLVCGLVFKKLFKSKSRFVSRLLSMLIASAVMSIGYFFAEIFVGMILNVGDSRAIIVYALFSFVPSILQSVMGIVIAMLASPKILSIDSINNKKF